jgi:hypothetical protein
MSADGGIFGIPGNAPNTAGCTGPTTTTACCARQALPVTLDDALKGWITHADALQVQLQPQGQNHGNAG